MTDLLLLAERVEAAEGPDARIDAEIVAALNNALLKPYPPQTDFGPGQKWQFWSLDGKHFLGNEARAPFKVLPVTASLDASLTLVPEGWSFEIKRNYCHLVTEDGVRVATEGWAATPALALAAACLRARSTMEGLS